MYKCGRTFVENDAKTSEMVITTVPHRAVPRKPNRSAMIPDRNPAMYVTADPVVPIKAIDDEVASGKTLW